ncbi:hypothetical protein MRX96_056951 [Rhipicephalus microplus]
MGLFLRTSRGIKFLIVATDYLMKWTEVRAVPDSSDSARPHVHQRVRHVSTRGAQVKYPGRGQPSSRTRDHKDHQNTYSFEEKTGNETPPCTHREHGNLVAESHRVSTNHSKDRDGHINGWGEENHLNGPEMENQDIQDQGL